MRSTHDDIALVSYPSEEKSCGKSARSCCLLIVLEPVPLSLSVCALLVACLSLCWFTLVCVYVASGVDEISAALSVQRESDAGLRRNSCLLSPTDPALYVFMTQAS